MVKLERISDGWEAGAFFANGELPLPMGSRHRRSAPHQAYRTKDGWVTVGAANNERFIERKAVSDGLRELERVRS